MRAVYKCRLCGKRYFDGETNRSTAIAFIAGLTTNEYFEIDEQLGISRTDIHNCEDGSLGFADFQGFKKESEENK